MMSKHELWYYSILLLQYTVIMVYCYRGTSINGNEKSGKKETGFVKSGQGAGQ